MTILAAALLAAPAAAIAVAPAAQDSAVTRAETQASGEAQDEPVRATPVVSIDDAHGALKRSLDYLVRTQNDDGSWARGTQESLLEDIFAPESFYAWQMASQAIACQALLEADESTARRKALDEGLMWLCTSRLPKRGANWDIDYVWTMLYGFAACVAAAGDERYAGDDWQARIAERGQDFYAMLADHQSVRGGWAYYDNPPYPKHPMWATSFSTACVLPALCEARDELDWGIDAAVVERAVRYVERCALPNGAYAYSGDSIPRFAGESINNVKGSLGRIQVCNWALARAGVERITEDRVREGLAAFFQHHMFLDVARMKPIPHEAYYANAGYFYYFGHYYAAQAIELLPAAEREGWHAKLRWHLIKTQQADGSTTDFQAGGYIRVACTAFTALALQAGLNSDG